MNTLRPTSKKILFNFTFALVAATIVSCLIPVPMELEWRLKIILIFCTLFFFVASLCGEEKYDITIYWPNWLRKIILTISKTIAVILCLAGLVLVCVLIIM